MRIPIIPGEIEADFGELTPQQIARLIKAEDSKHRALSIEEIGGLLRRLRASKKFRQWTLSDINLPLHQQQHHSPAYWAQAWGVSTDTIRLLFQNEDGVIIIGDVKGTRRKRRYRTMEIPDSVAARVHKRLSTR